MKIQLKFIVQGAPHVVVNYYIAVGNIWSTLYTLHFSDPCVKPRNLLFWSFLSLLPLPTRLEKVGLLKQEVKPKNQILFVGFGNAFVRRETEREMRLLGFFCVQTMRWSKKNRIVVYRLGMLLAGTQWYF